MAKRLRSFGWFAFNTIPNLAWWIDFFRQGRITMVVMDWSSAAYWTTSVVLAAVWVASAVQLFKSLRAKSVQAPPERETDRALVWAVLRDLTAEQRQHLLQIVDSGYGSRILARTWPVEILEDRGLIIVTNVADRDTWVCRLHPLAEPFIREYYSVPENRHRGPQ